YNSEGRRVYIKTGDFQLDLSSSYFFSNYEHQEEKKPNLQF
ncbi:10200_t:CDS:2, partial [Entrophospora sp. SA101]